MSKYFFDNKVIGVIFRRLLLAVIACGIALPAVADVLVLGGTRGVGLETVRLLAQSGEPVTVMVRPTSDLTALNEIDGVNTVQGDALQADDMTKAFSSGEYTAVISTLSGNPKAGFSVDSVGNINAVDAAVAAGTERFVLISSIGVGDSAATMPANVLKALGAVLAEKAKAESHLTESGLSYTIIRPGGLTDKPANGKGILSEDPAATGIISRAEVARLAVESLSDAATVGKIYAAVEQK